MINNPNENYWWLKKCLVCGEYHESGNLPCTNYKWDTSEFINLIKDYKVTQEHVDKLRSKMLEDVEAITITREFLDRTYKL